MTHPNGPCFAVPDCNEWYTLDAPALSRNIARFGHSAEVYDNKMYVFGGFNGLVLNDMFEYQPGEFGISLLLNWIYYLLCHNSLIQIGWMAGFQGICPSHLDKESCLASREGVKCVWANDDKCLSAVDADDKYAHKNIQKIIPDTCQSRDLGEALLSIWAWISQQHSAQLTQPELVKNIAFSWFIDGSILFREPWQILQLPAAALVPAPAASLMHCNVSGVAAVALSSQTVMAER